MSVKTKTLPTKKAPADGAETPMRRTAALGVEFWNDSCHLKELAHAAAEGAVGATSNPVIVGAAVENDRERWLPVLDELVRKSPRATEDDIAWKLIEAVAREAARILLPAYRESEGARGYLCVQVSPKLYRDPKRMLEQAKDLSALGKNIAIKAPATAAGIGVMEELVAAGIPVNATVSFTLAQALACGEAMERGRKRAGRDVPGYVTLMVGRLDDQLKRVAERDKVAAAPEHLDWAGIAVFKKTVSAFRRRKLRSKPLVAAYRHSRHWTELIGPGIVQSIPYNWWTQFNGQAAPTRATLDDAVPAPVLETLERFPDFRRAYAEDGLKPAEFVRYAASVHTLNQFLGGYQKVLDLVRARLFHLD